MPNTLEGTSCQCSSIESSDCTQTPWPPIVGSLFEHTRLQAKYPNLKPEQSDYITRITALGMPILRQYSASPSHTFALTPLPTQVPTTLLQSSIKPYTTACDISQILPNIYLGQVADVKSFIQQQKATKPWLIINAAAMHVSRGRFSRGLPLNHESPQLQDKKPLWQDYATNSGIRLEAYSHVLTIDSLNHLVFNLIIKDNSSENIHRFFEPVLKYISDAVKNNQQVIICCAAGISRSVILLLAFILKFSDISNVDGAIEFVKKYRPCIKPNDGFIAQLNEYNKSITKSSDTILFKTNLDTISSLEDPETKIDTLPKMDLSSRPSSINSIRC